MKKLILPVSPLHFRTGQLGPSGPITLPITFLDFLHDNVLVGIGKKLKDVQRALVIYRKVVQAVEDKKTFVYLDKSHVDELQHVCETADWNMLLAMQFEPFFAAIENAAKAKDEEPLGLVPPPDEECDVCEP